MILALSVAVSISYFIKDMPTRCICRLKHLNYYINLETDRVAEAVVRRFSLKNLLRKIWSNSLENIYEAVFL